MWVTASGGIAIENYRTASCNGGLPVVRVMAGEEPWGLNVKDVREQKRPAGSVLRAINGGRRPPYNNFSEQFLMGLAARP